MTGAAASGPAAGAGVVAGGGVVACSTAAGTAAGAVASCAITGLAKDIKAINKQTAK
jgi:hypothetical protein